MHSDRQSQIANMPGFTPPPSHADRPTRSTTCHSPAPRRSFLGKARGESSRLAESRRRPATRFCGQGARQVIGVGPVKTPTLAIVCKRELEIRNFVPIAYFEVVATAKVAGGQFQMRPAPQAPIF